ncbi:MAG TPA: adenylate/guanylate cyclase domain-containing protein [Sedimentisphaerales bacterium]|nr:adenylate/guanylate cyclase domain-containing protein [Sedimentisphaerales bacterium]
MSGKLDPIKPSPELAAVAARWLNALKNKQRETLTNMFSASEHIRYIGSSFNELWSGQILRNGYADHAEEIPEFTIENDAIEAFESSNTGWASWVGELRFPENDTACVERFTWVFVLEHGVWKIAHVHVSNPTSNIEKLGVEHTAFDRLISAAKEEFSAPSGEDTATVMFTDIADSSSIAATIGDRAWAKVISEHLRALSETIEGNGGKIVKTLGDGTMSCFSSARNALTSAISIQKLTRQESGGHVLEVRIGMHTGDVVQSNGDFFGTVVNKAARIAASASPGQILVSEASRSMVEGSPEFTFESPISVALRGIEGDHSISTLAYT